jgi:hypothetical protein
MPPINQLNQHFNRQGLKKNAYRSITNFVVNNWFELCRTGSSCAAMASRKVEEAENT